MLTWSNTTATGGSKPNAVGAAIVSAPSGAFFLWNATAQQLDTNSIVSNESSRSATTCYMRGLSERIRIQTNSSIPWFHRRICFTTKGQTFLGGGLQDPTPNNPANNFVDTSQGMQRLWFNVLNNNTPNTFNTYIGILFRGQLNSDWNDLILAPVDKSRVTLKSDQTWTIASGNASGVVRERKLWHPMNNNLVYDDDEVGDGKSTSYVSTDANVGMGDYMVLDIVQAGLGGTSSDLMQIQSNATLYWHER